MWLNVGMGVSGWPTRNMGYMKNETAKPPAPRAARKNNGLYDEFRSRLSMGSFTFCCLLMIDMRFLY